MNNTRFLLHGVCLLQLFVLVRDAFSDSSFLGLMSRSPLRDMEQEIARDEQTLVTFHVDVRTRFLWFIRDVIEVRCAIRAQRQCVRDHLCGPVCLQRSTLGSAGLFCCYTVQCLRSHVRDHDQFQAAQARRSHSFAHTCSTLFHLHYLARVQQTRFATTLLSNSWRYGQDGGLPWAVQFSTRIRM